MSDIDLIRSLLVDVGNLPHRNDGSLDALKRRTKMILTKIFGAHSSYVNDLEEVRFHTGVFYGGMPDSAHDRAWKWGKNEINNLLTTVLEELQLNSNDAIEQDEAKTKKEKVIQRDFRRSRP